MRQAVQAGDMSTDKAYVHQKAMLSSDAPDHYELLQISPNAEPETIHRVYRLLAQRYHPDNQHTGDERRFRALVDAYELLADPERRAQYDVAYHEVRKQRWHAVSAPERADNAIEVEQAIRVTVLEVLYEQRRADPTRPGVFVLDLEELTGHAREHLEFTVWYLTRKNLVAREDNSRLAITVDGVDYLEAQYLANGARKRLEAHAGSSSDQFASEA
jgi:curved DNA-binding protein CbpA